MYDVDVVIWLLELSPHACNGEVIQRTTIHSELFFTNSYFFFNFLKIIFWA